ncbi:polyprenol phosphomannose-dependent alpha 1,6 mannosyltransferase MptB, partial [Dietzia sp.]|uniref:polyprenol phosphomannose-dependent alpha 1,6 mannosyltransferase MptB n=1 Tax=Dietzia sp. TaxID=1871616 RepID=UPI002FDA411D
MDPSPTTLRGPALIGALGSTLVLLGSFGSGGLAGRVGPTAHESLRFLSTGSSGLASTMLVWAGTIVLVCAWCAVGARLRGGVGLDNGADGAGNAEHMGSRQPAGPTRAQWALLFAAWIAPLLPALPVFSTDAFSYLAQGQMLGGPADPYVDGPGTGDGFLARFVSPDWRNTPTPYGALHLVLMSGVAHLAPSSPWLAVISLRVVVIAFVAASAWIVSKIAELTVVPRGRALWLGVANPIVVVHLVGGLHNDAFILAFVLGATWCACAAAGPHRGGATAFRRTLLLLATAGVLIGLA